MKKLFFAAIIAVFAMTSVNAQTFGVKAGLNLANLTGDIDNNKALTSFHVGAVAEFEISDEFSFQPELVYSAQGTHIKYSEDLGGGNSYDADYKVNLSYLNLPLMGKYEVSEGISLLAGPQIGFLMSAKSDGNDIKDSMKGIDFGVNLGAAYELESGMFFDLRYNIGLSNIADSNNVTIKNSVLSVSLGYKFN